MFRGINKVTLDGKSRLLVPARVREQMQGEAEGRVVVTIDLAERALLLYPLSAWERVQDTLVNLANVRRDIRTVQRLMIGHATDLELDGQGRLLLPKPLREHAGLGKQIVLVGQGNKVEIWDEANWTERKNSWLDSDAIRTLDELDELNGFSI
ncbi:MAG: division/cell wall cluster transcriptional repressor MraZ [Pseudomonadota bacterium]